MSSYEDQLKDTKRALDQISPSLCLAKWLQVTLHLHEGTNHSCHHPRVHLIPLEEIKNNPSAIHNTNFKKEQRKKMLSGERPKECNYCWTIEDLPGSHFSDRIIKSNDDWARPHLDQIIQLPASADVNPTYVEVAFSRSCNFRCIYCSARVSTSWDQELSQWGPMPILDGFHYNTMTQHYRSSEENPYIEAFWRWWPELVSSLKWFRITGGEPLLAHETFKILKFLRDSNRAYPDLNLSLNSNLGVETKLVDKLADDVRYLLDHSKIKSFHLYFSIDTWGPQAEYIRFGLDLKRFERNLGQLMKLLPEAKYSIMCTFNFLSVFSFDQLIKKVADWKKQVPLVLDISLLRNPRHLDLHLLPEEFATVLRKLPQLMREYEFYPYEINKMSRAVDYFNETPPSNLNVELYRHEFISFAKQLELRRGIRFTEAFPELTLFYEKYTV